MPSKHELANYCANLLSIIGSKEDAGQDRGGTIAREYTRAYDELTSIIRKEEEDETRKWKFDPHRSENRTEQSSGQSFGSRSTRAGIGDDKVSGADVRR